MRNITRKMLLPAAATAALMLSGCGDAVDEQEAALDAEDPAAIEGADGMTDTMVAGNMMGNGMMGNGMTGNAMTGNAMAGGTAMAGEGTAASLEPAQMRGEVERLQRDMTSRNVTLTDPANNPQATFAELDRNSDGRLSPAEYAIYDLSNVNPNRQGAKDDEAAPFVSDEALNMSITGFRRHDSDGNFFLTPAEFTAGVRG